ncbi:uncharacterized protein BDZ99DRAFT_259024 [Mytilinidion resinicola]|uniref:N-acetyltransferase domain-containing protein n=1 Tax=Mytilinidion resinicola TaxID=574789 RepID=A0A6A6YYN8_9PEZI|nr:uncharacterized protein BDZ99DRAFT_259024 [Mytilinidion resinicola]KAF2813553.1 hypothetical protein BDZ99DRAFT_259024 [Mytilinidion resinicola]
MPPNISFHLLPKPPLFTPNPTLWPSLQQKVEGFRSLAHSESPAEWEAQEERSGATREWDRRRRLGLESWVFVAVEQPNKNIDKDQDRDGNNNEDDVASQERVRKSDIVLEDAEADASNLPFPDDVVGQGVKEGSTQSSQDDEAKAEEFPVFDDEAPGHGGMEISTQDLPADKVSDDEGPGYSDLEDSSTTIQATKTDPTERLILDNEGLEQADMEALGSTLGNEEDDEAWNEAEAEEMATLLHGEWIGTLNLIGPQDNGSGGNNAEAYWEYEIKSLFVLPGKRRQGVGGGMLQKAIKEGISTCGKRGHGRVKFSVDIKEWEEGDREQVKEWFRRAGFEVGTRM